MRSFTSRRFRSMFANLPDHIKRDARRAYQLFRRDATHPGLRFKKVEGQSDMYSARVGLGYRALAYIDGNDLVWFWIGSHADYDKLLRQRL